MKSTLLALILVVLATGPAPAGPKLDRAAKKAIGALAIDWWRARPKTRFEEWDATKRSALVARAKAIGAIPDGALDDVVKLLWKPVPRHGPRAKTAGRGKLTIDTPYGEAWFYLRGSGKGKGLVVGLHGGGVDAGSADEAAGKWNVKNSLGAYPQGIRLVHDTWNTVHGERFVLTILEIAKAQYAIDPDRVTCAGFSMGGTGTWFLAGRHPDLWSGVSPCAGVLMAQPRSQLPRKELIQRLQHGLVPNVRNLPMHYFIGLEDKNCMPGTYLFAADLLDELRKSDEGGYAKIEFKTYEGLAHAFPAGEPAAALKFLASQRRDPTPKTLVWEYAAHPYPRAGGDEPVERIVKRHFYWLGCRAPRDRQRVRVARDGNTVTVETEGTASKAKGLTIYLRPEMFDPTADVVVRSSDGAELYRGRPVPDLWTVLETLDAKLDRRLVFDRRIDL